MQDKRLAWADIAKGLSIVLVVYGHAVVGVNKDVPLEPWLFDTIMKPFSQFRMPLFFFVAGLFAAISISRDWRRFLDRTILHLAYVFIVWNVLQYGGRMAFSAYANDPIDPVRILLFPYLPINITWFIWALIFYYLVLKLTRGLPVGIVLALAAIPAIFPVTVDHYPLQQASAFFFFFVLGYALSDRVRGWKGDPSGAMVAALAATYLAASQLAVHLGLIENTVLSFGLRLFGILATISICMWLARKGHGGWLRWLGGYTLSIFVMHTIVTAGMREVLLRAGISSHPAVLIGMATLAGVLVPLAFQWTLARLGFPWLFQRPGWFHLPAARQPDAAGLAPATGGSGRA